jgi:CDP-6-deoxy-D-xylo-4-hexulose-3-dehydrase
MSEADALREKILALTREYHRIRQSEQPYVPGTTPVPPSGKVLDADDFAALVDASLDGWLTAGRFARAFERRFAKLFGSRDARLVNSGSSANLVAVSALTSPKLGDRRLRPGDEVLTVAAGFPTTVNPIVQNGLVPVLVDSELGTWNVDPNRLAEAVGPRTRAIVLAHTLGNPFDLEAVTAIAARHDLWLVEDCCDALGSTWGGRSVGTFGALATASFYPAHHITMGEGGAVVVNQAALAPIVESFRDWGRDCWCDPGCDDTCGKRFGWQLGNLPQGYDHKYTYSHIGYNLKATDLQAAIGLTQLDKLPAFIAARRRNVALLREALSDLEDVLILPRVCAGANPSWFGFPIGVRDHAPISRDQLVRALEARRIGTRLLFGGNLARQPAYAETTFRIPAPLDVADYITRGVLWVGAWPGVEDTMRAEIVATIRRAFGR